MSEKESLATSEARDRAAAAPAASRVRYRVLMFLGALGAVTYLDRVSISVAAQPMMRDLGFNALQMGAVFSAFTLAYAIFEIPTGWWGDRRGTRRVLARIVTWWSAFTMLTGAAAGYASLLVTRFLFGAGEAGAWPNVARTASRWFPLTRRGTAQGVFFMGCHISGGLTPLLVTAMLVSMSWRAVFATFGAVGFLWAAAWYWWFRDEPAEHPAVNQHELELIRAGRAAPAHTGHEWAFFRLLLRDRNVLFISMMYFTQAYAV